MRFVGIDLGWTRGGTGLCAVADGRVLDSARVATDQEILGWVGPHVGGNVIAAVDAPLIVRNVAGRRPCDRMISRCFGAYHAGAHSANLGLASFRQGVRGERVVKTLGLSVDPFFEPGQPVRRALEVYPHPAIIALFGLPLTLKYKAKAGRPLASRSLALGELMRLLEGLEGADPALDVRAGPRWEVLRTLAAAPSSSGELDQVEDEVDAHVCAYVGLYYWTQGERRCRVVGDIDSGYILTPVDDRQVTCLEEQRGLLFDQPPSRPAASLDPVKGRSNP